MTLQLDPHRLLRLTFLGKIPEIQELFRLYPRVDVNMRDSEGRTPLIIATRQENLTLIALFIVKGANKNACDMYGKTALMYAEEYKFKEAISFLEGIKSPRKH